MHVLIVDDDVRILRFVATSLKLAGHTVCTATCGEDALKLAESDKPDVMVLDILMPEVDGFEVLRRLRDVSKLPVVAISAHSSSGEKAVKQGANVFLAKPFKPDELIRLITSLPVV